MSWHHGDYLSLAQAITAFIAVLGAFGVVFLQHFLQTRNERREKASAIKKSDFIVEAELAWVSSDVVGFLNQYCNTKVGEKYAYIVDEKEFSELLGRLSWCRQRVAHKGQLAMVGTLRNSLVRTARLMKIKAPYTPMIFQFQETKNLDEWRYDALGVMNHSNGLEVFKQYQP